MPLYEYACTNGECSSQDEVISIVKAMTNASSTEPCPSCREPMQRVFVTPPAGSVKGGTPRFHRRS